jgi:hypothetical protein
VRTDIAGFCGICERGPLPEDFPPDKFDGSQAVVKLTSWSQFLTNFGNCQEYSYLAYAVRAFFENGGAECHVARIAATSSPDPNQWPRKAFFTVPSAAAVAIGTVANLVDPFHCTFTLTGTHAPQANDLLVVAGGGVTELTHVAAILPNGQALLTEPLNGFPTGAPLSVSWFPPAFTISAASRGNWGNALCIQITPLGGPNFSLSATVDLGPNTLPTEDEYYRSLTLTAGAYNNAHDVLKAQSNLVRIDCASATSAPPIVFPQPPSPLATGIFYLQGGRNGLTGITLRDFVGGTTDLRGLRLLEAVDEIAMIAVPDAVFQTPPPPMAMMTPGDECAPSPSTPPDPAATDPTAGLTPLTPQQGGQIQRRMIDQCQRLLYRVAILDPPPNLQIGQVQVYPNNNGMVTSPGSRFAAIYYPWLKSPDPLQPNTPRDVPPSGYIAGAYAQNDLTYGVQRPPANIELDYVVDVVRDINDVQQEGLNLNNINAIRSFPGRGIRIWGARALAALSDSDWRFIHVRRLMSAIEETVLRSSRWIVFQTNNDALRNSLTHSLTVLLQGIWAKGGLQGAQPSEGFYVKCDTTNNPQTVIDLGQLICDVGIAIAAPMEFLVFEIRQDASGAQIVEN